MLDWLSASNDRLRYCDDSIDEKVFSILIMTVRLSEKVPQRAQATAKIASHASSLVAHSRPCKSATAALSSTQPPGTLSCCQLFRLTYLTEAPRMTGPALCRTDHLRGGSDQPLCCQPAIN